MRHRTSISIILLTASILLASMTVTNSPYATKKLKGGNAAVLFTTEPVVAFHDDDLSPAFRDKDVEWIILRTIKEKLIDYLKSQSLFTTVRNLQWNGLENCLIRKKISARGLASTYFTTLKKECMAQLRKDRCDFIILIDKCMVLNGVEDHDFYVDPDDADDENSGELLAGCRFIILYTKTEEWVSCGVVSETEGYNDLNQEDIRDLLNDLCDDIFDSTPFDNDD